MIASYTANARINQLLEGTPAKRAAAGQLPREAVGARKRRKQVGGWETVCRQGCWACSACACV
jgi:hypothetical protein